MRSDLVAKKGTDRYGSLLFLYLFRLISATSRSFGACFGLKAPWVPGFALLLSLCLAAAQSWAPSACSHGSTQEQNSGFASRSSDQSQCSQQHQQLHSSPAVDSWNPGNPGAPRGEWWVGYHQTSTNINKAAKLVGGVGRRLSDFPLTCGFFVFFCGVKVLGHFNRWGGYTSTESQKSLGLQCWTPKNPSEIQWVGFVLPSWTMVG